MSRKLWGLWVGLLHPSQIFLMEWFYDSTFLLIIISSILALILGQEFSSRTIDLEVNAGHSRKTIFFAKVISYLIAFNIMALVYPVAGCIRESVRFGITEAGNLCYQVSKAIYILCFEQCDFSYCNLDCFLVKKLCKSNSCYRFSHFCS